jgi:hypothetical protein
MAWVKLKLVIEKTDAVEMSREVQILEVLM